MLAGDANLASVPEALPPCYQQTEQIHDSSDKSNNKSIKLAPLATSLLASEFNDTRSSVENADPSTMKSKGQNESIVELNVGGTLFTTTIETLTLQSSSVFSVMFAPRNREMLGRGPHFFDRDPDAFAVILNYFRTGSLIVPPSVPVGLLETELDFFQVDLPKNLVPIFEAPQDRVVINVGGRRFETFRSTFARAPNSLLGVFFGPGGHAPSSKSLSATAALNVPHATNSANNMRSCSSPSFSSSPRTMTNPNSSSSNASSMSTGLASSPSSSKGPISSAPWPISICSRPASANSLYSSCSPPSSFSPISFFSGTSLNFNSSSASSSSSLSSQAVAAAGSNFTHRLSSSPLSSSPAMDESGSSNSNSNGSSSSSAVATGNSYGSSVTSTADIAAGVAPPTSAMQSQSTDVNNDNARYHRRTGSALSKEHTPDLAAAVADMAEQRTRYPQLDMHGEYFLDRDPDAFAAILHWYRTGKINEPPTMATSAFNDEIEFYGLKPQDLEASYQGPFVDVRQIAERNMRRRVMEIAEREFIPLIDAAAEQGLFAMTLEIASRSFIWSHGERASNKVKGTYTRVVRDVNEVIFLSQCPDVMKVLRNYLKEKRNIKMFAYKILNVRLADNTSTDTAYFELEFL